MLVLGRKLVWLEIVIMLLAVQIVNISPVSAAESKLTVVTLGDSYSAGTGGGNYFGKTGCYRSFNSYGQQYANKVESTGVSVEHINLACHGAMSWHLPSQAREIDARTRSRVDLVFVTIGGNDGGFESIIKYCFAPGVKSGDKCRAAVNDGFDLANSIKLSTKENLKTVLELFPGARVVLAGYPYPVDWPTNSCSLKLTMSNGGVYYSGEMVRSLTELSMALQTQLVKDLKAEFASRISYTTILDTFDGHENCGDKALWMRGNFSSVVVGEWWHPNKTGYNAIANHLFRLGLHTKLTDVFAYSSLPFTCGYKVNYVSTYDTTVVGGVTYHHNKAIDMPVPSGTTIVAPVSGIAYSKYDADGYGHYVEIHGDEGRMHRMGHMQGIGIIGDGIRVEKGQKVGLSGSTGVSTGPHLHYEQWQSGQQVNVNLGGPTLEWGLNLTSGGFRKTLHTLESTNCSNTAKPLDANELVFYNKDNGRSLFYDVHSNGGMSQLSSDTWSLGWDQIVEVEIDGDKGSELLFYNREATDTRGQAKVYNTSVRGLSSALAIHSWSNYWTHLIAIDLEGDGLDELLVYSAINGRYYFLDIAMNGSVTTISKGTWSLNWEQIKTLEFDGTPGDELVFYKVGSDRAFTKFYNVSTQGHLGPRGAPSWVNGWTHFVPLDIDGDNTDELIIYRETDGRYFFFDMKKDGVPISLVNGSWKAGWDYIVPLEVDISAGSELLFYDNGYAESASAPVYDVKLKGLGTKLAKYSWSKSWANILPVQLVK